jgi:hypothetical protein
MRGYSPKSGKPINSPKDRTARSAPAPSSLRLRPLAGTAAAEAEEAEPDAEAEAEAEVDAEVDAEEEEAAAVAGVTEPAKADDAFAPASPEQICRSRARPLQNGVRQYRTNPSAPGL